MDFSRWIIGVVCLLHGSIFGQLYQFTAPFRLEGTVNSSCDESNPVISSDGNTLFFVRTFDTKSIGGIYDQDIWYSTLMEGKWSPPKNLTSLNNKLNNAVVAMHMNPEDQMKSLYLISAYSNAKDLKKGVVIALKNQQDSSWVVGKKLPIPELDISGKYVGYYLSDDEQILLVSYEGSDSEGEEDLYFSLKTDGEWSPLEALSNTVNSAGFEMSPFLSAGNDTLFFSSNGFKGYGDADVFYSVRKGKWNSWTKPVNLGPQINSPYFDAYFSLHGSHALWSSNRDGKDLDLWSAWAIEPPKLTIKLDTISDVSEFQGMDGAIKISVVSGVKPYRFQWSNGITTEDLNSLRRGEYKLTLTDSIGQKIQETFIVNEPSAKEESILRFPNIQYKFGSWDFIVDSTVNSRDSLLAIAKLLEDYPKMVIELISHTDARGDEVKNQILSENRARACYQYLVKERNIDPRRIIPVGKGESNPAYWYDREQGRLVQLTESYIQEKKENTALFELLHQINRRTEGRILRLDFDPVNAPSAPKEYMEFLTIPK